MAVLSANSGPSTSSGRLNPRVASAQGVIVSRVGLRFNRDLAFDQWVTIGRRAALRADASLWWLGDWLVYGSRAYGRRYKHGIERTGLDYQTLRNYAMVARRFELSRRRDTLSFQHHAEVCALPDDVQDRWLDRAEAGGWSRNELRRRLREEHHSKASQPLARLDLKVDPVRQERWREAAALIGRDLSSWMIDTLDEAARALLTTARSS